MSEVHIIAKGSGNEDAPEDGETFGVNDVILRRNQLSMCFHMHDMDWIKRKEEHALKLIIQKAEKNKIPIMTTKVYDWIPTSVEFPLDDIVKKFGACYFGSSIDYMITYAMFKEYDIINLYGVNMVLKNEYCISPESLVLCHDLLWRKAKEINIGDEIVAFDENLGVRVTIIDVIEKQR